MANILTYTKDEKDKVNEMFSVFSQLCKHRNFTFYDDSHMKGYMYCKENAWKECFLDNCPYCIEKVKRGEQ